MSDVLVVRLHDQDVGEIVRFSGGRIQFEFYPEYVAQRDRPTLSLSFLDDDGEVTGGGQYTDNGEVPDFSRTCCRKESCGPTWRPRRVSLIRASSSCLSCSEGTCQELSR